MGYASVRNGLLLFASGLLGLLVLEVAVRVLEPEEAVRSRFIAPDLVLHHRFVPGARGRHRTNEFDVSYAINSLGLRDREVGQQKPAGVCRILMLGDSFTEGDGVEQDQTFSSRLQALLDREGRGARWQVLNGGVGSYSPLLAYLYLKNAGLQLQPDLVVLHVDLSDAYDDIQYARQAVVDDRGEPTAVQAPASAFQESQRWRAEVSEPEEAPSSRPVRLLIEAKDVVKEHLRLYGFVRRRLAAHVAAAKQTNTSGDIQVDKFAMLRDGYRGDMDRDWSLSLGYITMIRDRLAAEGIDVWVTVYPYGMQVSPREWAAGRKVRGFESGRVYPTEPQDRLERLCREAGIPVVNLCEDFRALARTVHPIYYDLDGHWRPVGHELVADVLHRKLAPYLGLRDEGDRATPSPSCVE
jgi:hypothetical protein